MIRITLILVASLVLFAGCKYDQVMTPIEPMSGEGASDAEGCSTFSEMVNDTPRVLPTEAVEIYARAVETWCFNKEFADRGTSFLFADFDCDGVLELIREDCEGTGHYTMTTIYRIMPDNSVKEFHVTCDVDFSCFFRWDISPKLLKRNNGELLWLLTGFTTSNAVGSERYYTLGTVQRNGSGFHGTEFAAKTSSKCSAISDTEIFDYYLIMPNEDGRPTAHPVTESEYNAAVSKFLSDFEVLEVALAGIELPHVASVKELDIKTIHTALMKAYGEFGYKGYPFQNLLSNFRRSIEFEL